MRSLPTSPLMCSIIKHAKNNMTRKTRWQPDISRLAAAILDICRRALAPGGARMAGRCLKPVHERTDAMLDLW